MGSKTTCLKRNEHPSNRICIIIISFLLFVFALPLTPLTAEVKYTDGRLSNGIISVVFDEQGTFSIHDAKTNEALLSGARFGLPSGELPNSVKLLEHEDVQDALGIGKRLVFEIEDWNLLRYGSFRASGAPPAPSLFSYTLYENNPALVLGFGLKTHYYISMRLTKSQPLAGGQLFGGAKMDHPLYIVGEDGVIVRDY